MVTGRFAESKALIHAPHTQTGLHMAQHRCINLSAFGIAFWVSVAAIAVCVRPVAGSCGCTAKQEASFYESILSSNVTDNRTLAGTPSPSKYSDAIRIDDMLIPKEDFEFAQAADGSSSSGRSNALPSQYINCRRLWPKGKLYYRFSTFYPSAYKSLIRQSLVKLSYATSYLVTFEEASYYSNVAHVTIIDGDGCWSYVGKVSNSESQELSLEVPGCMLESIVQHEFMHALGFAHEQSRLDRDSYVSIQWSNIDSDHCSNFYKNSYLIPSDFPSYDYGSVMHYMSSAFACYSSLSTIVKRNGGTISVRNSLSTYDAFKLRYMYSTSNLKYCTSSTAAVVTASCGHVLICLLLLLLY